jgi:hypothetical protein
VSRLKDIGLPRLNDFSTFSSWFQVFIEFFSRVDLLEISIAPASVAANITAEQTFTVTTVELNDIVIPIKPTHQAGLGIVNTRVTAAGTVGITYMNTTVGAIVPTTETYKFLVFRLGT